MKILLTIQWIIVIIALTLFVFGWGFIFGIWHDYYQENLILRADTVNIGN